MPHLILEHSSDISCKHDVQALCDRLFEKLAAHPAITSPDTVRTRALPCDAFRLGIEVQSFAHATLLLLPGRDDPTRENLAQIILDELCQSLPDIGSLTVRLDDINPPYLKRML